jgi:hypothetical protein
MMKKLLSSTLTFIILAGLAAAVITLVVSYEDPRELGEWFRTLAATLLSTLFAVAAGIWLFNRQTEVADERRREQLVEGLIAEVENLKDEVIADTNPAAFTPVITESGNFCQVLLPEGLELITFDDAIRSGLLPTNVTVQLINLAGFVRAYNSRVRRAQSTLQAEAINKKEVVERGAGYLLDSTVEFLESGRKKVEEECERMLDRLEQLKD